MTIEILVLLGQPDDMDADDSQKTWRRVYNATPPGDAGEGGIGEHEVSVRLDPCGGVVVISDPPTCVRPYGPLVVKMQVVCTRATTAEQVCAGVRCIALDADGLAHPFDWRATRTQDDVLVITFVSPMSIRRMFRWVIEERAHAV
jgi:hypothetical protein